MKTLHRTKGIAHDLVVTRDGTILTLWSAAGVRHTVVDLGAPHIPGLEYARNMLLSLVFSPRADSVLMLGLGGGSIARMLLAAKPALIVDAVEIDPAVEEIARRFFQVEGFPNFNVRLEDAAAYVAHGGRRYDILILDAYIGDRLSPQCATREFFQAAGLRLTEAGVLVVNWMKGDPERYRELLSNIRDGVGEPWALHGNRARNTLLFAAARPATRQELLARAERLADELPFASDLMRLAGRLKPCPAFHGA